MGRVQINSAFMAKLLVVEDSPDTLLIITAALQPLNFHVFTATSAAEAERYIAKQVFDFFILDLGLPDGDGLSILNRIRRDSHLQNTPAIIVSSNSNMDSKLAAFSIGADDYITKPFNILELRARVESKMRRGFSGSESGEYIQAGPLILETNKQLVQVKDGGSSIRLSPTEFRLLSLFARKPDNVFSRDQILSQIWGDNISVTDRTVDTHIYTLRKKLGIFGDLIQSIQGEGYRFVQD